MAHSLERRWAKLVQSYDRLKGLYDKSLAREKILIDELRDARAEVRSLKREAKERERASKNTMEHLFATTRYAISSLYESRNLFAAEKLEGWLEAMEDTMQPVANVEHLIKLLEEWCVAMPFDDPDKAGAAWFKTQMMLNQIQGKDEDDE